MTPHQQDHALDDVVSNERIAMRLHSWLLIMCLGYPVVLVVLFMFGPRLAVEYVFSGFCLLVGTGYPIALVIILAWIKHQHTVPISWFLIIGPAVWIAALSWFYIWIMGELVASC